jgi:lipopolysaccharide transport system permease protein
LYFLIWRDIKVRYAQTAVGIAWAVLQPLLTTLLFTLVFGRFVRVPSEGAPYPVFALVGLVLWTYVSTAVAGAANSLIENPALITKVYLPRLILPLAPAVAGLLDLLVGFLLLLVVMVSFGVHLSVAGVLALPLALLPVLLAVIGIGAGLAAVNAHYRDVRYVIPFVLQLWMFASPVAYPLSVVPHQYQWWYALNPLVGSIETLRSGLLRTTAFPTTVFMISMTSSIALALLGVMAFRYKERTFADVV